MTLLKVWRDHSPNIAKSYRLPLRGLLVLPAIRYSLVVGLDDLSPPPSELLQKDVSSKKVYLLQVTPYNFDESVC
jgi:hypothetical protein